MWGRYNFDHSHLVFFVAGSYLAVKSRVDRPHQSALSYCVRLTSYHLEYMGVSKNTGTPKSSILIGISIINHPFWGIPIFGNTYMFEFESSLENAASWFWDTPWCSPLILPQIFQKSQECISWDGKLTIIYGVSCTINLDWCSWLFQPTPKNLWSPAFFSNNQPFPEYKRPTRRFFDAPAIIHPKFQVPRMEGFLNYNIRPFWGWFFPYINRIHTAIIGEYLHFMYPKCLANHVSFTHNKLAKTHPWTC